MENYKIYCKLKAELITKNVQLLEKKANAANIEDIISLEVDIEEDLNALNMIFNHMISQNSLQNQHR